MPSKKYTDFEESVPIQRRGKLPPYEPCNYVEITCPHCKKVCAEIRETLVKQTKSTECIKHLRLCPEFNGEVPPKRSTATSELTTVASLQEKSSTTVDPQEFERYKETVNQLQKQQAQHHIWWGHLAAHLELAPPQDPPVMINAVKLLKESAGSSSAIIPSTTLNQFQQDQDIFNTMLTQKDSVISDQKLMMEQHEAAHRREMEQNEMFLREKAERIATLERERDQYARIVRQKQEEIDRIKAEKSTMEGNLRAQIKRQKCGSSSSLLAQAQQSHKEHYKRSRSPSPR